MAFMHRREFSFAFAQGCHKAALFLLCQDDIDIGDVSEGPVGDHFVLTVECINQPDMLRVEGACLALGGQKV